MLEAPPHMPVGQRPPPPPPHRLAAKRGPRALPQAPPIFGDFPRRLRRISEIRRPGAQVAALGVGSRGAPRRPSDSRRSSGSTRGLRSGAPQPRRLIDGHALSGERGDARCLYAGRFRARVRGALEGELRRRRSHRSNRAAAAN